MTADIDPLQTRIVSRQELSLSPWVRIIRKEVSVYADLPTEIYHSLGQADYVAILARTPNGQIPIVRQFRSAVEAFTWELPGGLVDANEAPDLTCQRELLEETGLRAETIEKLGTYYPDTGRLENRLHAYSVSATAHDPQFVPEPGMQVAFVTIDEFFERIRDGDFKHQLHIGVVFEYLLRSKVVP